MHTMAEDRTRCWRELCFAAATESDPDKLLEILALLSSAVVDRQKQLTAEMHNCEEPRFGSTEKHLHWLQ